MGQQIAARLYRWRRYSGGVRQCERTSVKSGASIMQRGGDRSTSEIHPRRGRIVGPLGGRESIRHGAERYIYLRRIERRNVSGNRCFIAFRKTVVFTYVLKHEQRLVFSR